MSISSAAEAAANISAVHNFGEGSGWQLVGPAVECRYLRFSSGDCEAGNALQEVASILRSVHFLKYLQELTGLQGCGAQEVEVRRFLPGRDYVRRRCSNTPRLDAILCLGCGGKAWKGLGGADGYVEEVNSSKAGGLLAAVQLPPPLVRLPPASNTLRLVLRDEETAHYIETPSDRAPGSRWDISIGLALEPFSEDEEEEEEEGEQASSEAED